MYNLLIAPWIDLFQDPLGNWRPSYLIVLIFGPFEWSTYMAAKFVPFLTTGGLLALAVSLRSQSGSMTLFRRIFYGLGIGLAVGLTYYAIAPFVSDLSRYLTEDGCALPQAHGDRGYLALNLHAFSPRSDAACMSLIVAGIWYYGIFVWGGVAIASQNTNGSDRVHAFDLVKAAWWGLLTAGVTMHVLILFDLIRISLRFPWGV